MNPFTHRTATCRIHTAIASAHWRRLPIHRIHRPAARQIRPPQAQIRPPADRSCPSPSPDLCRPRSHSSTGSSEGDGGATFHRRRICVCLHPVAPCCTLATGATARHAAAGLVCHRAAHCRQPRSGTYAYDIVAPQEGRSSTTCTVRSEGEKRMR